MGKAGIAKAGMSALSGLAGGGGKGGGGSVNANIDPQLLQFLMNEGTKGQRSTYAGEGLGGSTMEAAGTGFSHLAALQQANQSAQTTGQQQLQAQQQQNQANNLAGQQVNQLASSAGTLAGGSSSGGLSSIGSLFG